MCLAAADKGGVSALRLSKMVGVSWPTAQSMLRKPRRAMGDRDRSCRLTGLVEADVRLLAEVDEAFGQMSGLATHEVLRRQFEVFGEKPFGGCA